MIRVGRWQFSAEGAVILAVVAIVAVFGVGRCSGRDDGAADANLAHAQATGYRLAQATRAKRDSLAKERARAQRAEASESRQRARVRSTEVRLAGALDALEDALADTAVSRDTLQARCLACLERSRALLAQNAVWRDSVAAMVASFHVERAGYLSALSLADSTIAAKDSVIGLLTKRAQCRVLWALPCPTRTQAFTLGSAITLTLVLL